MWRGPWGMTLRELLALELRREAGFSVDLLAQDLQPLAQVVHRDPRALPGPHRLSNCPLMAPAPPCFVSQEPCVRPPGSQGCIVPFFVS